MNPLASSLAAFTAAAALLTVTPGLDTALVLRTAAVEGSRRALTAALGICLGCLAWGAVVALGLGMLLKASLLAYTILKYAGAAYLLWLGVQLLLSRRERFDAPVRAGSGNWLARGFLTNALNPKVGVFYVSFLPQFVPAGSEVAAVTLLLAAIHAMLGLLWFAVLVAATRPLARALQRPRVIRALDRATGAVFLLFAARLALSRD
ncbi:MAG TPA: LysE family translocator [Allosphingosinicella sp.]|jgi:threonine/homoserine/homoserine lactone efflux protein|nr:LysE family translocator [Allosphingosinicella sp.]